VLSSSPIRKRKRAQYFPPGEAAHHLGARAALRLGHQEAALREHAVQTAGLPLERVATPVGRLLAKAEHRPEVLLV